jgi:PHD/YefM family antitoxin component YafN of YafNO toxin-antitoxin module
MTGLPSVDDIRADLPAVLARFRAGRTRAFSFGAGVPEAVLLTYDEFEDLGGETKFAVGTDVLEPDELAQRLTAAVDAARAGSGNPVVWGEAGEPEAVVLSTAQYRQLRGDDAPPAGVVDDPTVRTYTTEPLPNSRPLNLDEWAAGDPFTQELLDEIRAEERPPGSDR